MEGYTQEELDKLISRTETALKKAVSSSEIEELREELEFYRSEKDGIDWSIAKITSVIF